MPIRAEGRKKIFVSYSHNDSEWLKRVQKHLKPLDRDGLVELWDDTKIQTGTKWREEIEIALNSARVAVLLISADFIASDFIAENELPPLLAAAEKDGVKILSLILSPSRYEKIESLSQYQSVNPPSQPLIELSKGEQERYLVKLSDDVLSAMAEAEKTPAETGRAESRRIFNLPFPRNKFFTGRDEILNRLHPGFNDGERVQALNGLGGVGKTQTALEYAYRRRQDYEVVLWANASSREALVTDFAAMAELLNLPEKNAQDQNEAVGAVKRWLENNPAWLLILDNADDVEMAREFMPSGETGHLLLTTRAHYVGTIAEGNALEKMTPAEGALFLLRRVKKVKKDESLESAAVEMRTQAEALSDAVDGLPLALDQAAAYIEEMRLALDEYLDFYRSERARLLQTRGRLTDGHPESVAVTFSVTFKKVAEANRAAADMLRLCAFLEADAIPEEIFGGGAEGLGEALSAVAINPAGLIEAIKEAGRFSLLQRNAEARTLSLHRLAQSVLQDEMDIEDERRWAERAVRAVNRVFPDVEYSNWPLCSRLISHAQLLASLIDKYGFDFPEAARIMNQAGAYLRERAQYAEAEPLLKHALAIREKVFGAQHPDVATSLNDLATLYDNQGKYSEAEPLFQRALAIREKVLGAQHPDVASSLNNLAVLYKKQGKYAEAEPLYQRALAIYEKVLGAERPDVATSLNNLASLYDSQGKYSEAEPLFQRALAVREKVLGAEHPLVATSLNNLASLYCNQGKYAEAEPLLIRALAINEKVLGAEHPLVATSLNNLATLYDNQGKYAEAEPLFQRDLAISEKVLGAEHPDVATSLNNLAVLYYNQGKYAEAEPLYLGALAIREKVLGAKHPDVAISLNNLAALYDDQGKYAEAELLHQRALAIYEKALGAEHPSVATSLNNLAALYDNQGKYAEAEPLWRKELAVCEQRYGADDLQTAANLNRLLRCLQEQGLHKEALPLCRRVLAIREQRMEAGHFEIASSLNNLGLSLVSLEGDDNLAEAEQRLLRATQIDEQFPDPRYWLARLYQKRGRDGDREREIAEWKRYLELGPTSEERRNEAVARLEDLSGQGRL